jgi:hypothetical protein
MANALIGMALRSMNVLREFRLTKFDADRHETTAAVGLRVSKSFSHLLQLNVARWRKVCNEYRKVIKKKRFVTSPWSSFVDRWSSMYDFTVGSQQYEVEIQTSG